MSFSQAARWALSDCAKQAQAVAEEFREQAFPDGATITTKVVEAGIAEAFESFASKLRKQARED